MSASRPLLSARSLRTWYPAGGRWFGTRRWIRAVDGVDLDLFEGEVLGLVGESGCGKTTLGRSLLRLVEPTDGRIFFDGEELMELPTRALRPFRRRMQIVFQDPYASLSPRMQIRSLLAEPLRLHGLVRKEELDGRIAGLLGRVKLEPYFMWRYPHEMSGGQRQRIAIARALALEPDLLVADEPVSALDASVQAQILSILLELQRRDGIAILFISHDLGVVERIADRIAVMFAGRIVEEGPAAALLAAPLHPYTEALVSAMPDLEPGRRRRGRGRRSGRSAAEGGGRLPAEASYGDAGRGERAVERGWAAGGCPYAPRCPEAEARCRRVLPLLERKVEGRRAACHRR